MTKQWVEKWSLIRRLKGERMEMKKQNEETQAKCKWQKQDTELTE